MEERMKKVGSNCLKNVKQKEKNNEWENFKLTPYEMTDLPLRF